MNHQLSSTPLWKHQLSKLGRTGQSIPVALPSWMQPQETTMKDELDSISPTQTEHLWANKSAWNHTLRLFVTKTYQIYLSRGFLWPTISLLLLAICMFLSSHRATILQTYIVVGTQARFKIWILNVVLVHDLNGKTECICHFQTFYHLSESWGYVYSSWMQESDAAGNPQKSWHQPARMVTYKRHYVQNKVLAKKTLHLKH